MVFLVVYVYIKVVDWNWILKKVFICLINVEFYLDFFKIREIVFKWLKGWKIYNVY